MNTRWFDGQRELKAASARPSESQASGPQSRFPKEEAFWRSWLATGARRVPIDRRRARGREAHLKKILVGGPSGAVDFSSAMGRQSVDEALLELPQRHKQVVKLAYFGGLTNREIAQELGFSVSEVRRVLRVSLASVGAHFERGRAKGRRAIQHLALVPLWKGIGDAAFRTPLPALDHVLQTGIVVIMTAAAALLVSHQGPSHVEHRSQPAHIASVGSVQPNVLHAHTAILVDSVNVDSPTTSVVAAAKRLGPVPALPVKVTLPVQLPVDIPAPPTVSKPRVPVSAQLPFGI